MPSTNSSLPSPVTSSFPASLSGEESSVCQKIISTLNLRPHIEGGYFVETDRDPTEVPNPFLTEDGPKDQGQQRNASTSIYYYLTPSNPQGHFHRNKARTVHTLHKGRGRYVIIHANEADTTRGARIETFVVGHDVEKGERLQWVVEGGKYKASFLLPDEGSSESHGLLISETVVPGFDYRDHDFLKETYYRQLVPPERADELRWLVRGDQI